MATPLARQAGAGWYPHWPTDLFVNYRDEDVLLGLNAAQTTLASLAQPAGTRAAK